MARKISVEIVGDSASLERSFKRASASAAGFNRDLSRAGRGVIAVTAGYRSLARSVAFASGAFVGAAGLTAGLKASVSGFAQFQNAMQQAVGLAGVAQNQIAGVSREVLKLAPVVGKSPQELATAFYFVASSGIAASKAMDVVTQAAKASAAGLGETQVVADAVTSAMNAYGPAMLSAQKATDVLVATVREGKGEADQFAGVIGNVAALASQLGVSFDQVGAALAAQTRLGTDAETAATQLQRVFSSLIKVTPQQAKAFKSVGLNADQLRATLGERDGLLKVLEQVQKAFSGNLPALAKAFGDIRAVRGVLSLVGSQADATRTIFDHLAHSAGATASAFDAVSKDTAQQFRQMRASAEVAGIAVGSLFAPLAGKVAEALTAAAGEFTAFVNKISGEQTIRGKLNVVWEGISGAAEGATAALAAAVGRVDWAQVWSSARGIADGLQRRLDEVNWGGIGTAIGNGIRDAIAKAAPAAQDLAKRISDVVAAINWVDLGKKAGPGLAAAMATAFVTITDPSFWVHNWDLALAVALTVFGGSIGKIAGKLAAPLVRVFGRLGGDAALAIASGFEQLSSRLGGIVLAGLLRLPGLAERALQPLTNVVSRTFGRLGGLARFAVKVLGIQAAINALAQFVQRVGHLIGSGLNDAWDAMERGAIRAVLAIIEPFTHLPGFLGGGPFRDMKNALQAQLDGMEAATKKTAAAIQNALAGVTSTASAAAETAASPGRAGARGVSPAAAVDTAAQAAVTKKIVDATRTATTAASQSVEKGFVLPFRLQLEQAKAAATKATRDDLKAAQDVRAFILRAIPHLQGDKLLGAYQELASVNSTLADAVKSAADKVKGFTVPLALQVAQARAEALGKDDALKGILERIKAAAEKALKSGRLGLQGQLDAWNQIASINNQLKNAATASLGKFRQANTRQLTEGLGLAADQIKQLRGRLSQLGPNGTVPMRGVGAFGVPIAAAAGDITVHVPVSIDGKVVANVVTKHQQKRARRNPSQRRGPHAGQ